MRKRLKQIIIYILMVFLLGNLSCVDVKADESLAIGMDQYRTEDGKIIIYVNHNRENGFQMKTEDSSVVVGKQSLPIETVKTFKDTKEPVSYMFVVDISGSMDKERIATVKETLVEFINTKKDVDNFCVATMGDELTSSGFSDEKQPLLDFVEGIEVTRQDTDLYKSIREELNVLKTDKNVHEKRCLVIFSDGADDQKDGITQSEAETQVKDTHIPVFTVALLPKNYKDYDLESAKILGSFARYSAGGQHYAPAIDGFECKEVCTKITRIIEDSLVVSADLADVTAADGNIYLGLELSDGTEKGKDGMQIPVGDILDAIKEAQSVQVNVNINKNEGGISGETVVEPSQETLVPQEDDASGLNRNKMLIIIVAIAAVLIIIIIAILVVIGKKKNAETKSSGVAGDPESHSGSDAGRTVGFAPGVHSEPVEKKAEKGIKITLYKVGPGEEEKYTLVLNGKKTLGRKSSCDLSFVNDNALSGIHCYLYYRDKKIYVQDNHSTNGTFINGVPITGEFAVESGDVLLAGSAEYRIMQEQG